MDKWVGKVAVVTGASSGIGAAIAKRLVAEGMQVVGLARRIDRMQELATEISSGEGKFHPMECDLFNEENIASTFEDIKTMLGGIDVMINNAGMAPPTSTLMDQEMDIHRKVLDLNVIALTSCTQKAMTSMMERDINGQIIHINSIYGHIVPMSRTLPSMYIASKHAVSALTETLRQQLILMNDLSIKVTSLSPGYVDTEIIRLEGGEINPHLADLEFLDPSDIADGVVYVLSTPTHVQVTELTIRRVGEKF